jgi:hypothetical protein
VFKYVARHLGSSHAELQAHADSVAPQIGSQVGGYLKTLPIFHHDFTDGFSLTLGLPPLFGTSLKTILGLRDPTDAEATAPRLQDLKDLAREIEVRPSPTLTPMHKSRSTARRRHLPTAPAGVAAQVRSASPAMPAAEPAPPQGARIRP